MRLDAKSGAQVLMVYPGPADQLKAHAAEFLTNRQWPANFLYVLDPDYAFTNAYGLHWEAPSASVAGNRTSLTGAGRSPP